MIWNSLLFILINPNWADDNPEECSQIEIITSQSPQYQQSKFIWNSRVNPVEPYGFVYPKSAQDVSNAVKCANGKNVPIAIRSGGHSYEGYSQGGSDGYLVIDIGNLNDVKVDPSTQIAQIGGGSRLGHIYGSLWSSGNFSIPAGECPTVGIGGHATGGGYGHYSRTYGMVTDNIKELEVVTATGDIVKCNQTHNQDLFWALRGSGTGSYGVVTQFHIKAFQVKNTILNFKFMIPTTVETFPDIFSQIQDWITNGISENIGITLNINKNGILLKGVVLGDSAEKQDKIARDMVKALPIEQTTYPFTRVPFIDAVLAFSDVPKVSSLVDLTNIQGLKEQEYFKSRGGYINRPLPKELLKTFATHLKEWPEVLYISMDVQGGAFDRPELLKETSVPYRNNIMFCQTVYFVKTKAEGEDLLKFENDAYSTFAPYFNGTYMNSMNADITNWQQVYFGNNLDELSRVKKKWDPMNRFNNPRSVPLPQ